MTIPMRWVEAPQSGQVVSLSSQTTFAKPSGTSMTVTTDGLTKGHAYTLWFTFFNHPEECRFPPPLPDTTLRCGFLDLLNPKTDGSFVFGDGLVAAGRADTFEAFVAKGRPPAGERDCNGHTCEDEQVAFAWMDDDTAVLTDPLTAEYQATLRSHGPKDKKYMPEQVETLNGGCHAGEPYHPCRDEQASGLRTQLPVECVEGAACFTSVVDPHAPFVLGTRFWSPRHM